jgi:formate dehydrogenase subunit delta
VEIQHLVTMANQIGNFHRSFPDHAEAVKGTAMHLRRSWEPRMRRALLAHIDATQGEGLEPIVMEAIVAYRKELTPPPVVAPASG